MKKFFRKIVSAVLAIVLATSSSIALFNNERVNAANFGNYTVVAQNVPVTWVSSHSLSTAISNTLSAAGAPIPSGRDGVSNTGNYNVDGNSGFMCITSSASSPSQSPSGLGKVYRCVNEGIYDNSGDSADPYGVLSRLSGKSYSQIVYGCLRAAQSSNDGWNMAHAILSHLIGTDNSWFGPLANSEVRNLVEAFAKTASNYATCGIGNPFFVFVPNDGSSYQCLISTSFTPTPRSMSVSFNKTDGTNLLAGAVIQFYSTSEGTDTSEIDVQVRSSVSNFSGITNGIQFTTTGQGITIVGLKTNSTYVFHEVTPPVGYQSDNDITVTVDSNGNVTSSQGSSTVTMVDNPLSTELIFNKREEDRETPVAGAVIQLRPTDSSSVIPDDVSWVGSAASNIHRTSEGFIEFTTTDSPDNQLILTGLPIGGNYYFAEVQVPEGFRIAQDMYFMVNDDGTIPEQIMVDETQPPAPGYGDLRICKEYSEDFASEVSIVYFYVYYNHEVDGTAYPFNRGYRIQNGENDTWIASGYLITGNNQHEVWWNIVHDDLLYGGESGINEWRLNRNENGRYYTMDEMSDRSWLQWLPYGRYTVVEVWCDPSIEGDDVSTRLYQQALNASRWREIDTLDISESGTRTNAVDGRPTSDLENARWHRYATDIVITEGSTSHSLTGEGGNSNYDEYDNNPNTGAVWLRNDTTGATVDLEKVTSDVSSLNDLRFELWSTGNYGFRLATGVIDGSTGTDNHYNVTWNYNIRVSNTEGGHGSTPGTEDVYNSPGQSAQAIYTTVNTTRARVSGLPAGTYEFREYATGSTNLSNFAVPEGWTLVTDSTGTYFSKYFTISSQNADYRQQINETIRNDSGSITVYKVDEDTGERLVNYPGIYDATFALYEDRNGNGLLDSGDVKVAELADSDRDGAVTFDFDNIYPNVGAGSIPVTFLVVETVAPEGYYLNDTAYSVNTQVEKTVEISLADRKLPAISVYKVDEWTGAVLTGYEGPYDAAFALYEDNNNNGTLDADDTLVITLSDDDRDGLVIFDFANIYPANKKISEIPSNFLIVETQAPYGFYLNDTVYPVNLSSNTTAAVRCVDTPYTVHIDVMKVDGDTAEFIPNAQFTVYNDVDGNNLFTEGVDTVAQTFNGTSMTDATFTYNSATNRYVSSDLRPGNYVVVETNLPDGYFYVDDSGLPSLTPNEAYFEIENRDTSLPTFEVATYETTEYNVKPEISTTLTSPVTGSHIAPVSETTELVDEVYYHNLVPNQEYVMTGTLYDKNTGNVLLDRNGNPVTATTTFTPTMSTGTVNVTFIVDTAYIMECVTNGTMTAPTDLVAFEDCRFSDGVEVAVHADINDEGQTVTVGRVQTTAGSSDSAGISTIRSANGLVTIVDTAYYEGLEPHTTYRMYGELHLVTCDANGNRIDGGAITPRSNEVTYRWVEFTTGDSHEGTVDMTFIIDAARFKGQDIVCFEYIYLGDTQIMSHADINSREQTLLVPGIASEAFCPDTCTQVLPYDASVTVTDTIYYSNLEAGVQYEVEGSLNWVRHNADGSVDTGAVEGASAYVVFRPDEDSTDGTVTMTFVFDTRRYADMGADEIVVFEHLTHYGHLLAKDADLNNRLQTLTLPQLHTNASDVNTTSQTMPETTATQVTDRVTYTGLTVGQQYTVSGCLQYVVTDMNGNDVEHGTLVQNGMPVTAEVTFVPTTPNGEVTLTFNVDVSELMSRHIDRVVAFERLYYGAGILLAVHEDLNDKDQTVEVCDLRTTATVDGEHVARLVSDVTLVDRIYFEGLTVGREYRVETDLMRRSTGMSIVHKTTVFTATTTEGYIDVEMHFDASGFSSSDYVVVFENGYDNETGLLIRSHQDWSDMDQTVTFRRGGNGGGGTPAPTPTPWSPGIPSTGENMSVGTWVGTILLTVGCICILIIIHKRFKETKF